MSEISPTRSAVIEAKDERRAMHEGYVFLDEKCLLLAGEILRELARHGRLQAELLACLDAALAALRDAVLRHGLQGLQIYPATDLSGARLATRSRSLMGVRLQDAVLERVAAAHDEAVDRSPEAEACRRAFAAVLDAAAAVAAVSGNLERLSSEYRRSVRRARALQDVMLPELDQTIYEIENRLEELEREDAVSMRRGGMAASGPA
ncbi:V-type ATP synthase subunit D [uncultured Piscinibacter sp.]|uniref:V-type ATP synthase subunit D n=1 Tax=uncultured Piscinibacter sp. TaxID=1131835 RepID=UPI0026032676|nr:V-type ATP synthase subunit D [uncultured Piscinibacter sp.]